MPIVSLSGASAKCLNCKLLVCAHCPRILMKTKTQCYTLVWILTTILYVVCILCGGFALCCAVSGVLLVCLHTTAHRLGHKAGPQGISPPTISSKYNPGGKLSLYLYPTLIAISF